MDLTFIPPSKIHKLATHPRIVELPCSGLKPRPEEKAYGRWSWKQSDGSWVRPRSIFDAHSEAPVIPREEWPEIIHRKTDEGSWLKDILTQIPTSQVIGGVENPIRMDQDGLGYCWVYCVTRALMAAWYISQGQTRVISPESVGGPINNWRNRGGWPGDALERFIDVGGCAIEYMDEPNSLRPSKWKDGWEEDCANHRVDVSGVLDCNPIPFDATVSCCLNNTPTVVTYNWWNHAVMGFVQIIDVQSANIEILDAMGEAGWWNDFDYEVCCKDRDYYGAGRFSVVPWNNWGDNTEFPVFAERKGTPDDSFAILSNKLTFV